MERSESKDSVIEQEGEEGAAEAEEEGDVSGAGAIGAGGSRWRGR